MAATLALVEVVVSSASKSSAKRCNSASRAVVVALFRAVFGAQRLGVDPLFAQVAHHGVGMPMRQQDAACARFAKRAQQRRPVGMVGQNETAVVAAAPPVAAHAHPARAEAAAVLAEAADPRRTGRA